MKRNRKLLSLLLAVLLLAAQTVPALAANQYTPLVLQKDDFKITERLMLGDADLSDNTVTYTFSVVPYSGQKVNGEGEGLNTAFVGAPEIDGSDKITFDSSSTVKTDSSGNRYVEGEITLKFKDCVTVSEPGLYRWTIQKTMSYVGLEVPPTNNVALIDVFAKVDDDESATTLTLIEVDGGYLYTSHIQTPNGPDPAVNPAIPNPGGQISPTNPIQIPEALDALNNGKLGRIVDTFDADLHKLVFGKEVEGNGGSKDKYFKFTLVLDEMLPGTEVTISGTHDLDPKPTAATLYTEADMNTNSVPKLVAISDPTSSGAGTDYDGKIVWDVYLQDGQYVTVEGLPNGTFYTVREDKEDYAKKKLGSDTTLDSGEYGTEKEAASNEAALIKGRIDATQDMIDNALNPLIAAFELAKNDKAAAIDRVKTALGKSTDPASDASTASAYAKLNKAQEDYDNAKAVLGDPSDAATTLVAGSTTELTKYAKLKKAEEELAAAQADVDAYQLAVDNASNDVDAAQLAINNKKAEIDGFNAQIASITAQLNNQKDAAIAKQTEYIKYLDAQIAYKFAQIALVKAQIKELEDQGITSHVDLDNQLATLRTELGSEEVSGVEVAKTPAEGLHKTKEDAQDVLDELNANGISADVDVLNALRAQRGEAGDLPNNASTASLYAQLNYATKELGVDTDDEMATTDVSGTSKPTLYANLAIAQKALTDANTALAPYITTLNNKKTARDAALEDIDSQKLVIALAKMDLVGKQAVVTKLQDDLLALDTENVDLEAYLVALNNYKAELARKVDELTDEWNKEKNSTRIHNDPYTGTISNKNIYTGYTNVKERPTPTGILLQQGAPLVGLLLAAALFTVLALTRRRRG